MSNKENPELISKVVYSEYDGFYVISFCEGKLEQIVYLSKPEAQELLNKMKVIVK